MIKPKTPSGTMELLPREQITAQRMMDVIRDGFEKFGFLPVETPVFEERDILLTKEGGETEKQVYFVQSTGAIEQGKTPDLAMRFDLTVPLARYVAQHEKDLSFPFRRYQMQRVYRGERAQKGRYREFYQCDIDVIGKDDLSIHFDAEMPAIIHGIFAKLDIGGFVISLNNRKLLRGFLEGLGLSEPDAQGEVLRTIDKLDKIGHDKVMALLGDGGLGDDALKLVDQFLRLTDGDVMSGLKGLGINNDLFQTGLSELVTVLDGLKALGVPDVSYRINPTIARGLDYYTGTIYETHLTGAPHLGSICSGGRYDNLAEHYTKSHLPGVGISIGFTRLLYHLMEQGKLDAPVSVSKVMIAQFAADDAVSNQKLAAQLRSAGINTEVWVQEAKLAKQFKYAAKSGIPFVALQGPEEKENGTVQLKNMGSGEQETLAIDALLGRF